MVKRIVTVVSVLLIVALMGGCGGDGPAATPQPGPGDDPSAVQVGPLMIQPAAAGLQVRDIPSEGEAAFIALYGSKIDYMAIRELLDRIVFSSFRSPMNWDIWVCDLFGENLHRVAGTGHPDRYPTWSPDGTRIAFAQERDGAGEADVMDVHATGGGVTNLTNSTDYDTHPTWSPSGDRIAFQSDRTTNWEIHAMYADGSGVVNLTNHASIDGAPDWSPDRTMGGISFLTSRHGNTEIYTMSQDGSDQTRVTDIAGDATNPSWSPEGYLLAFCSYVTGVGSDIMEVTSDGADRGALVDTSHYDDYPCYSSDGRFLAYESDEGGGFNVWLRQLEPPYRRYRVTDGSGSDGYPDLGSPTVQTSRVLIGAAGSDHGYNPLWGSAVAGIVAFSSEGYLNFVRPGIYAADAGSVQINALAASTGLVGVEIRANSIQNLREDTGMGSPLELWDFDPDPPVVIVYLHPETGKIVAVLLPSATRPTSAPAAATSHARGTDSVIDGAFSHVYDSTGTLVAEGAIGRVVIDAFGDVKAAF